MNPESKNLSPGTVAFLAVIGLAFLGWKAAPFLSDDPQTVQAALNGPPASPEPVDAPITQTVEHRLASLENGGYVAYDDPNVKRLGEDLTFLQKRYPKPRREIGDTFFAIHRALVESGRRDRSIADLMEETLRSAPREEKDLDVVAWAFLTKR